MHDNTFGIIQSEQQQKICSAMIKEKWWLSLFQDNPSRQPISDKNFKVLIQKIEPEYMPFIKVNSIWECLSVCPSLKKFNILNNFFHFENYSDPDKAKLISVLFLSGKEKIFKRALQLLLSDAVLALIPDTLSEQCCNQVALLNNDLSGNCYRFRNHFTKEQYQYIEPALSSVIVHSYQQNINSLFCQAIPRSDSHFQEKFEHKLKQLLHGNLLPFHNINFDNPDFYQFYNLEKQDFETFFTYFKGAINNPANFINYAFDKQILTKNIIKDRYEFILQELLPPIRYVPHPEYDAHVFSREMDKFFLLFERFNGNEFAELMEDIYYIHYKHIANRYSNDYDIKFQTCMANFFNKRLGEDVFRNIENLNFKDMLEQYDILQEKHFLKNGLAVSVSSKPVYRI